MSLPGSRGGTLVILTIAAALSAPAQRPETRTETIQAERAAKAQALKPETVSKWEERLRKFRDDKIMERITAGYNGFRAKIGNMVTGAGFAIGPEYFREDLLHGQLQFRTSAQFSFLGSQKYEVETALPKLAGDRLSFDLLASHRNYTRLGYYGSGPDSEKINRSNYRLEDTSVDAIGATRLGRYVKLGGSLGTLYANPGPGNDSRYISTEQKFPLGSTPAIDENVLYLRTSVFAQFDYRNNPLAPRKGGNYVMQYSWNDDRNHNLYNFRRLDINLEQYIPFFNERRVIALRAKTILTDTDNNEQIPFYLQPVLGGSDDLRGYRAFRFSGRNMVVYNAEYRWEVFAGLDAAIFADAGKVMPRRGMLNFRDLESDAGFGLRFNVRDVTFLRIDTAFSHEGFQVWFKFNDVFLQRRFGTTTGQPVY
ncbi:MAG: BamA/TamA family outer membrane protein [Bryobacterales bacterium]|nr:BamA/TamA family outer membrane protein [Bryobacterales bacterium]